MGAGARLAIVRTALALVGACSQASEVAVEAAQPAPTSPPAKDQVAYRIEIEGVDPAPARKISLVLAHENGRIRELAQGPTGMQGIATIVILGPSQGGFILGEANGKNIAWTYQDDYADYRDYPYGPALFPDGASQMRCLGVCELAGEKGQMWEATMTESGAVETKCITDDGIVLPTQTGANFQVRVIRGDQPESLFEIPEGYQKLQLPRCNVPVFEVMMGADCQ